MKFFVKNNQLDEMQENKMCLIESRSFWGIWLALLVALLVQQALGAPFSQYAAEFVIFILACVYNLIECIRNGLWDRHFLPTTGTNLLLSLAGGAFIALYFGVPFLRGFGADAPLWVSVLCAIIPGIFTAILCFALMQVAMAFYYKKHKRLENQDNEEGESE